MRQTERTLAADDDRYLDLEALAAYSGLSTKSLRRACTAAVNPLDYTMVRPTGTGRGRVLVRKRDFDRWVENQRRSGAEPATATGTDLSWMRKRT